MALEGDARRKHFFDEWWGWHQVLQFKVEDPLESLHAEWPQGGQAIQNACEVLLFLLRIWVVGHVIFQWTDHFVLEVLNFLWIGQAMTFCKKIKL